jgi:hypothetical protein
MMERMQQTTLLHILQQQLEIRFYIQILVVKQLQQVFYLQQD